MKRKTTSRSLLLHNKAVASAGRRPLAAGARSRASTSGDAAVPCHHSETRAPATTHHNGTAATAATTAALVASRAIQHAFPSTRATTPARASGRASTMHPLCPRAPAPPHGSVVVVVVGAAAATRDLSGSPAGDTGLRGIPREIVLSWAPRTRSGTSPSGVVGGGHPLERAG